MKRGYYRYSEGKNVIYVDITPIADDMFYAYIIDYKLCGYITINQRKISVEECNRIISNWKEISKEVFEEIDFLTKSQLNDSVLDYVYGKKED